MIWLLQYVFNLTLLKICSCNENTNFLIYCFKIQSLVERQNFFYLLLTWHLKSFAVTLKLCVFRNPSLILSEIMKSDKTTFKECEGCIVLNSELWKGLHLSSKLSIHNHSLYPCIRHSSTPLISCSMAWAGQGAGNRDALSRLPDYM